MTLDVRDGRLQVLRRFPVTTGWYLPDAETAIPAGFADSAAPDARKLRRLSDEAYVGPVGRGIRRISIRP